MTYQYDERCCNECGATEGVIEYHMTGYELNGDRLQPISGGIDYPVEYYWCNNCNQETDAMPFAEWHERKDNDN